MQCAERSPLPASCEEQIPRVTLDAESWSALARMHRPLDGAGRVVEASVSWLGSCGIDRYEVRARVVDLQGMFDDRIWLLARDELRALVDMLGERGAGRALARLMTAAPRRA